MWVREAAPASGSGLRQMLVLVQPLGVLECPPRPLFQIRDEEARDFMAGWYRFPDVEDGRAVAEPVVRGLLGLVDVFEGDTCLSKSV